jgi:site-specific recombinase XerC
MEQFLVCAKPDLQKARAEWLAALQRERRLAALTVEAYERDTRQFLHFMTGYNGGAPGVADIAALKPVDLRAFLAQRRKDGAGARSLGRGLAGIRSFLRFLERRGLANAAGATAMRAPKQPKSLPRPLTARDARRVVAAGEQLADEPWIAARDAAVLTLLYGSGLRISEALALTGGDLADEGATMLRVAGKGGKTRLAPVLPVGFRAVADYRRLCPCFAARVAGRSGPRSSSAPWPGCARRSAFPTAPRRTRCAILSPPTCSPAAAICAPSRNFSATPVFPPRRSIPASTPRGCSTSTTPRIPEPEGAA